MTRVGLIVYDHPTPKSESLMQRIGNKPSQSNEYRVFAVPFVERPKRTPLLEHRPDRVSFHPEELAKSLRMPFQRCLPDEIHGCEYYLILGAGLIPVRGRKILNAHAGLIPSMRGLDAFKWAIHDDQPLGVTLHEIDDNVDAGRIIHHSRTPIYSDDSIESAAWRHYSRELQLLVDADWLMGHGTVDNLPERDPHRRMPRDVESAMLAKWPEYRAKWAEPSPVCEP